MPEPMPTLALKGSFTTLTLSAAFCSSIRANAMSGLSCKARATACCRVRVDVSACRATHTKGRNKGQESHLDISSDCTWRTSAQREVEGSAAAHFRFGRNLAPVFVNH